MRLPVEVQTRVNSLSDGLLYQEAKQFAAENAAISPAQINSLVQYSQDLESLRAFINHQASRDWGNNRGHYKIFYQELARRMSDMKGRLVTEFGLLIDLGAKDQVEACLQLIMQEFIKHLAAEMLFLRGTNIRRGRDRNAGTGA